MSDVLQRAIDHCGKNEPQELPPSVWWLTSDAGPSYCHPCAWRASAAELGLQDREPKDWFHWDDDDRRINDGISGGDPCGGESEHSEHCESCGALLNYHLTSYGAADEIAHFEQYPPTADDVANPETAYALRRTLEACVYDDKLRARGEALATHILQSQGQQNEGAESSSQDQGEKK